MKRFSSNVLWLLAGTLSGLWLGGSLATPDEATAPPAGRPATPASLSSVTMTQTVNEPVISLAPDGRVTLHVDSQPLEWVLDELHAQGGPGSVLQAARVALKAGPERAEPDADPSCLAPAVPPPDLPARLQHGSEPERYDSLLRAHSEGGVSEQMVRTLYETDGSPRVRLLAFEVALQAHGGDPAALRRALEAARFLPDAVVAGDAARRLAALGDVDTPRDDAQQLASRQTR